MNRVITIIAMCLVAITAYAQEQADSMKTQELKEVVVNASYLTREDDHILAIPTKEQRKHAISGYDLLRNLMIPSISVNRTTGSVTTPAGSATLYIDGREV
ncbi:MAG: hypothetical protein NC221_02215, partial [Duncaniella sp.]|nr:hypothetical protein [Duncaniella sp.]MCM1453563.1 hypothetical protein [bacterium]